MQLSIFLFKTLGRDSFWRSVFCNPEDPDICVGLALATYLFTIGIQPDGSEEEIKNLLFGKENAEKRFGKALHEMLKQLDGSDQDQWKRLGINVSNLGTHSTRKGIATYISNLIQGPNGIALWLR